MAARRRSCLGESGDLIEHGGGVGRCRDPDGAEGGADADRGSMLGCHRGGGGRPVRRCWFRRSARRLGQRGIGAKAMRQRLGDRRSGVCGCRLLDRWRQVVDRRPSQPVPVNSVVPDRRPGPRQFLARRHPPRPVQHRRQPAADGAAHPPPRTRRAPPPQLEHTDAAGNSLPRRPSRPCRSPSPTIRQARDPRGITRHNHTDHTPQRRPNEDP